MPPPPPPPPPPPAAAPAAGDSVTLSRYANAVLGACQGLLEATEDAAGAAAVLPALLEALAQAARHPPAVQGRLQDLTDLLLGWALEPELPARVRSVPPEGNE